MILKTLQVSTDRTLEQRLKQGINLPDQFPIERKIKQRSIIIIGKRNAKIGFKARQQILSRIKSDISLTLGQKNQPTFQALNRLLTGARIITIDQRHSTRSSITFGTRQFNIFDQHVTGRFDIPRSDIPW